MKKVTVANLKNMSYEEINNLIPNDKFSVGELKLYMDNTRSLYNRKLAFIENYKKKMKKGSFDNVLGVKGLINLVNDGIRTYNKEFYSNFKLDSNDKIYIANEYLIDIMQYIKEEE